MTQALVPVRDLAAVMRREGQGGKLTAACFARRRGESVGAGVTAGCLDPDSGATGLATRGQSAAVALPGLLSVVRVVLLFFFFFIFLLFISGTSLSDVCDIIMEKCSTS